MDTIPLGVNFKTYLEKQVAKCRILLAVIGKEWLDVRDDQGRRRLDDPGDFVRIEIAAALEREIPVIPVLVGGRVPKPEELPEDLKDLAYRNGLEIRPDPDFFGDMNRLIRGIQKLLKEDLVVHEQNAGVQLIEPASTAGQRAVSEEEEERRRKEDLVREFSNFGKRIEEAKKKAASAELARLKREAEELKRKADVKTAPLLRLLR